MLPQKVNPYPDVFRKPKKGAIIPLHNNFLFDYSVKASKVLEIFQIKSWNYLSF